MSDPKSYAGHLSSEALEAMATGIHEIKIRSHALMRLETGHRVLDVGCGPGTDTIPLAEHVGADGQVVGVDYDPELLARADARAREAGVSGSVSHVKADAASLPFEDGYFDSCRSERVFQHLTDPQKALEEMVRVTRPGGWIVLADPDQGTASIDTPEIATERTIMRLRAETVFNNGFAGREHFRRLTGQGLQELSVELFDLRATKYQVSRQVDVFDHVEQLALERGLITPDALKRWHASLEKAEEQGTFFGLVTVVMVAGRKP